MHRVTWAMAVFGIGGLTVPLTARAGDPLSKEALAEGRERFQRGVELFRDGDHRTALIEFKRAYEVAPSYKIQFNIGQTCLELQDYACALRAYSQYLADGGRLVPKDRRQVVEREIERTKGLVGSVRIVVNKPDADVSVDDVSVGRAPLPEPLTVGAGRHKIVATLAPMPPATRVVDVAGGDTLEVSLDLVEAPTLPATPTRIDSPSSATWGPPREPDAFVPPSLTPAHSRTPFWIGVVTTSVLGAAAATTGLLALSANSDLDDDLARRDVTTDVIEASRERLKTFSLATDVLIATTVLAAGVTTVLYFASSKDRRSGGAPRWNARRGYTF